MCASQLLSCVWTRIRHRRRPPLASCRSDSTCQRRSFEHMMQHRGPVGVAVRERPGVRCAVRTVLGVAQKVSISHVRSRRRIVIRSHTKIILHPGSARCPPVNRQTRLAISSYDGPNCEVQPLRSRRRQYHRGQSRNLHRKRGAQLKALLQRGTLP